MKIIEGERSEIKWVANQLNRFNLSKVEALAPTWTPLDYLVKDHNDQIMAGLIAGIGYWQGLEINMLWVDETHRKKGVGSKLLAHVEHIAKSKGAVISMLDTFSFQAKGFYLKNGYQLFGQIDDFPAGHQRYYLNKRL